MPKFLQLVVQFDELVLFLAASTCLEHAPIDDLHFAQRMQFLRDVL